MAKQELTRSKELSVETTAPDASKTFTYWLLGQSTTILIT